MKEHCSALSHMHESAVSCLGSVPAVTHVILVQNLKADRGIFHVSFRIQNHRSVIIVVDERSVYITIVPILCGC
jgi:hypothetical protein